MRAVNGRERSLAPGAAVAAQGKLAANCWLLSSVACLTEYQDALPVLFADRGRALQEINKARARPRSPNSERPTRPQSAR